MSFGFFASGPSARRRPHASLREEGIPQKSPAAEFKPHQELETLRLDDRVLRALQIGGIYRGRLSHVSATARFVVAPSSTSPSEDGSPIVSGPAQTAPRVGNASALTTAPITPSIGAGYPASASMRPCADQLEAWQCRLGVPATTPASRTWFMRYGHGATRRVDEGLEPAPSEFGQALRRASDGSSNAIARLD